MGKVEPRNLEHLKEALERSWSKATTYDKEGWTPENPALGQCFVSAYLVWCYFKGKIKVAFIENLDSWHYWNILPDGTEVDLTKSQFPEDIDIPTGKILDIDWNDAFSNSWTRERCELLKQRVEKFLKKEKKK